MVAASPLRDRCVEPVDRESAYELLSVRMRQEVAFREAVNAIEAEEGGWRTPVEPTSRRRERSAPPADDGVVGQVLDFPIMRSMLRSVGTVIGREIGRSTFGTRRRR